MRMCKRTRFSLHFQTWFRQHLQTKPLIGCRSNQISSPFRLRSPPGFEVKEDQNRIRVAKPPYLNIEETPKEMGAYDAFFRLTRYDSNNTSESLLTLYRKRLKNIQESAVLVDKSSYLILKGDDGPRTEGDNYPNELDVVFFNDSWLEIIDRQINSWENITNPIAIGKQILSTLKFNP